MLLEQIEEGERLMNYLSDWGEAAVGLPGFMPRFPERRSPITFHQVNVDRSNVGVINTGRIETVHAAAGIVQQQGNAEVANALNELAEAVRASTEADEEAKARLLELLETLATEAAAPPESRKRTVFGAVLRDFGTAIGAFNGLSALWARYGPILESLLH